MLLTIVLPLWNEEEGLPTSVAAAIEACEHAVATGEVGDYEIVLVDDGSTDSTPALARRLASDDRHVRVVHHAVNRGLGAAVRSGLAASRGDVVLYTDADLPCDLLHELPRALRLLRIYHADVVSAYRHDRTSEGQLRAVYSAVYNTLIRTAFRMPLRDVNFAFKLLRRRVIDDVDLRSEGSFIDAELLLRARSRGYRIIQFGVDYFPRSRGVSTLSSVSTIVGIVRELAQMRRELAAAPRRRAVPEPAVSRERRRLLVVAADDYGLTDGVSRGILRAHRDGIVTSTSMLVLAPAFETTAKWLLDEESLGVGVHLAAVGEDPPLLSAAEVPSLVDRRGRLARSWRSFLPAVATGRIDPADLEREFDAQLEAAKALGRPLSHVDTHQHLHLWPAVGDVVLRLALRHGIGAVRVPRSRATVKGSGINALANRLARRAGCDGLAYPAWAAGLDEAGHMHGRRLDVAFEELARRRGPVELSTHPGEPDGALARYRWGYDWTRELEALTAPAAADLVARHGFRLATYHDIARSWLLDL